VTIPYTGTPFRDGAAREAVLVPVKAFSLAKERLAPALSAAERSALARDLATGVVLSVSPLPVAVVCDDQDVADWASELGAKVIWAPGEGLNAAVAHGVEQLESLGVEFIVVAHGDIPEPRHLRSLPQFDGITIVPDRHDDGTNVIRLPRGSGFAFSYGPGSFSRHVAEAGRLALPLSILRDDELAIDIDVPGDLGLSAP
jgi:2-phospho-L-lactate guanylyltransferase